MKDPREYLEYDPKTGFFTWVYRDDARSQWNGRYAGRRAGSISARGDRQIMLRPLMLKEHRLAFLFMTGKWPENEVDHINNDQTDNRWENLREASSSQQKQNSRKRSDNTSGFKGVSWSKQKGKWVSSIHIDGKRKHLGFFDDRKTAHDAYVMAAKLHYGEFANAG